jgi:CMP-N,N'-diacetyllegionaminic acid synthase
MSLKSVAFIPARSGSKRIDDKNIRPLADHPLLAYSIRAAIESTVFDAVICATDSTEYAEIATYYGAEVPLIRPSEISGDNSPDIEWVLWMLKELEYKNRFYEIFSILRPTSPFRLPSTIQRAWKTFIADPNADSLRAVNKCKQHPGKMWVLQGQRMHPLFPFAVDSTPWHSNQYSVLPEVYAQNASLEIAWTRVPLQNNSIAGEVIIPFESKDLEGFDINEPEDWVMAEYYLKNNIAELPFIKSL